MNNFPIPLATAVIGDNILLILPASLDKAPASPNIPAPTPQPFIVLPNTLTGSTTKVSKFLPT